MKTKLRGMRKQDAALKDGKFCGVAAMIAVGGAALSAYSANEQTNAMEDANQANIDAAKMDPRLEGIMYGSGTEGDGGLLGKYQGLGNAPQDPRLQGYGNANLDYLGNAVADQGMIRDAAGKLIGGNAAPMTGPAAWATGNMIDAPSQNNIDLRGSYERMISGDSAANPYLTGAIQGGIKQSEQAFGRMQDDSTRNLQDVLGGLRSNSVLAGQYGGSRQGIAEGRALGDFGRAQQTAIQNFGDNNTAAAVGAQAGEFGRGQDRSLTAMMGLGGQQYGVAGANAATKNAAEFMNVGNVQQSQLANQNAMLQTNGQNQAGAIAGAGLLGGAMNNAYGVGTNQDNYDLNRATQTNGLLQPYVLKNNNVPAAQPVFSNTGGAALGGAMAGVGLLNQFNQLQGSGTPAAGSAQAWQNTQNGWNNGMGFGGYTP